MRKSFHHYGSGETLDGLKPQTSEQMFASGGRLNGPAIEIQPGMFILQVDLPGASE